jgi:PIN domain nuclease of toxin-antitoxin system
MGCTGQHLDPHARSQIQVEFALKHAKMSPIDRFIIRTGPTPERSWCTLDRLYIRHMFAMGCTGQYLDPHAQSQILALKHAKMSPIDRFIIRTGPTRDRS